MKKLTVFLCIFLIIISIGISSYAKYIFEDVKLVANINIDGEIPKIEFTNVSNTNTQYSNYANKTHTVVVEFRVKERNIKEDNVRNDIEFLLDDKTYDPSKKVTRRAYGEYVYYTYTLFGLKKNGRLKIKIPEGAVIDIADQVNEETIFDTGIQIDNIAPVVSFIQDERANGAVLANIKANEKIREVNAWNLSEDDTVLSKEFECNVEYPFNVTDLAGNSTKIDVKIDKATKIVFRFGTASEGKYNNWEYITGINEVAGVKALSYDKQNRIEMLSLYTNGVDTDFMQMNCFINTYWGEGGQGTNSYEIYYYHGYNPTNGGYAALKTGPITALEGKATLVLGGHNVNTEGYTGTGGKYEPVSEEAANNHTLGVTALSMKLKDDSYYSIVYQVWVEEIGWLEPAIDGEETTVAHDKPIGATRVVLIPKTERQYLIDSWKKDVGTNNMIE